MANSMNRTAVQYVTGDPRDVAQIVVSTIPVPARDELLVELVIAPINPAEILMLQGTYGFRDSRPELPRNLGIEGVGVVVGGATSVVPLGSLVSLAGAPNVFSDYRLIPAATALVLNPDIDPEVFALSFVNVQAVLMMFHEWSELGMGDWIIQNAGNSAYARILDAVANRKGITVLNIVRSEESAAKVAGVLHGPVLVDGIDLDAKVLAVTGGTRPKIAIDAVGGSSTGRLAETLESGGRVVSYGVMSGLDMQIDPRLILFNDIRVEGFWMPRSMQRLSREVAGSIAKEAEAIIAEKRIHVPIESRFSLSDIALALEQALKGQRNGKVVIIR
jgi:trans-2-enoyl-CoA reductase